MLTHEEQREYDRIAARTERKILSTYLRHETKADKALHHYGRTLWVRACDGLHTIWRKSARLAHRYADRLIDG